MSFAFKVATHNITEGIALIAAFLITYINRYCLTLLFIYLLKFSSLKQSVMDQELGDSFPSFR